MRNALLNVLLFCVAGASMAQTSPIAPKLPRDVRAIVERITLCEHFAEEFNGDKSDRMV
jgi:hypothetical protein